MWYDTQDEVWSFGQILNEASVLVDKDAVFDYFEKPWKWELEYKTWHRLGRPTPDDNSEAWNKFVGYCVDSNREEIES